MRLMPTAQPLILPSRAFRDRLSFRFLRQGRHRIGLTSVRLWCESGLEKRGYNFPRSISCRQVRMRDARGCYTSLLSVLRPKLACSPLASLPMIRSRGGCLAKAHETFSIRLLSLYGRNYFFGLRTIRRVSAGGSVAVDFYGNAFLSARSSL